MKKYVIEDERELIQRHLGKAAAHIRKAMEAVTDYEEDDEEEEEEDDWEEEKATRRSAKHCRYN